MITDAEIIEEMGFEICEFTPDDDHCEQCLEPRKQLYFSGSDGDGVYFCLDCIKDMHFDNLSDLKRIHELEALGHSAHCATRQVYGDGECECEMYAKGYDPHAWQDMAKSKGDGLPRSARNDGQESADV